MHTLSPSGGSASMSACVLMTWPLALGVAHQADDLRVLRVAENDGVVALFRVDADFAGDDPHVRAGGVLELHAEIFQITAALGRDAMRAHDHHRAFLFLRLRG